MESESEEEDFYGFELSDIQKKNESDEEDLDESDISVSTVNTSDLSDFSEDEEDEELNEATWGNSREAVTIRPFVSRTGPVSGIIDNGTAKDFFHLMFPEQLIEHLVEETNRYAAQCIERKADPKWRETSTDEMKAFLGLQVLFGIKKLPSTRLYWSTDPVLGVPEVQKIMPRNRFDKITQYLHVNDNNNAHPRGHERHDKLFKIRPIIDAVVKQCRTEYLPTQNVSVDEAMVKFKGRSYLNQYMPNKPVKRGIKVWECADASSGYVFHFQVYTGKKQDGVTEHGP